MVFSTSTPAAKSNQKLALSILVVWLCLCAALFWQFQFRYIIPFEEYWASFQGESFKKNRIQPTQGYTAVVMHFVDNTCPCSRFAEVHISDLEQKYKSEVEFIRFDSAEADRHPQVDFSQLEVPASPAVAVWNHNGDLAYLGPYSGGAICGQGKDFVTLTLDSLSEHHNPEWFNQEAIGCFCQWQIPQELSYAD